MFCSKCGQPVSEDDNVCRMCGNVLNTTTYNGCNKQAKASNAALILLGIGVGLAILVCAIFIFSSIGKTISHSGSDYDYLDDPDYYQNTFESCHSTYEHKQALYSYDLNNDNYLSQYELELFAKAHPRFVQDKAFVAWVEGQLG